MPSKDLAFAGSMPALYDRYLGAMLFEPYAAEIAAAAPGIRIEATDLSDAMVAHGAATAGANVHWSVADALELPFDDHCFDAGVCQFGAMLFPDRVRAFAEMRRVLKPGATFVLNVWDGIAHNDVARIVSDTVATTLPMERPTFLERVPYGHGDPVKLERELRDAGFETVTFERVEKRSAGTARDAATGFCRGTPLAVEILACGDDADDAMERTIDDVTSALQSALGGERIDGAMHAFVFSAR